ncbi:MAG: FtsX-like permease family protein [Planctomycetes bacterium]|nr:FtsX-like permease family protein [Planctomycetota bacterium]
MRHWLQLATRNWRAKPGRTAAIILAVTLGVGTVVAVSSLYASVEQTIGEQIIDNWLGHSHISIQSPTGHWGSINESIAADVEKLEGITKVTARYKTRMHLITPVDFPDEGEEIDLTNARRDAIDVVGIDPAHESEFRKQKELIGAGIGENDRNVIVLESRLASELNISVGDTVFVEGLMNDPVRALKVCGIASGRRVAFFQKPTVSMHLRDVQEMRREIGRVSVIDCMVANEDPDYIDARAEDVRALVHAKGQGYLVSTAAAKITQLHGAQDMSRLVLLLFTFVTLLTSFFIIITTMSMGMMERVRVLGTVRCVGMTRRQLAALVYAEVVPLGVIGVVLGVPCGMAMTKTAVAFVPHVDEFVHDIVFGAWGIWVAVIGGLITTILGATVLLFQGTRVSPLEAVNPQAKPGKNSTIAWAAVGGVFLIVIHHAMIATIEPYLWLKPLILFVGTASLYGGYMLISPVLVLLAGKMALWIAAPLLGIDRRLASDQISRAPWRSAGVCWTLMVGLSLVVYVFVRGESVIHAWNFPTKLAGTFVWTVNPFPADLLDEVGDIEGVGDTTPLNDVQCQVRSRRKSLFSLLSSQSVFAAGDPDTFLSMAKLEFLQGNEEDAHEKLKRGGYILLPPEASHSFGYNLGDSVPITIANKTVNFEVAGVVKSPAMDIAVQYFQADSYMMLASSGSVLGTLGDLKKHFGINTLTMFMMNIDLSESKPPPAFDEDSAPPVAQRWWLNRIESWLPELPLADRRREEALAAIADLPPQERPFLGGVLNVMFRQHAQAARYLQDQWVELSPSARWELYRERIVLEQVKMLIRRPNAQTGTLRRIKQEIDRDIRIATLGISAVPMISLLVATLGVANLMMVNVTSRARQIAILRSVGATQSLIARLVMVEAMVLGMLGSLIGVGLGLHAAYSGNLLVTSLIGVEIPWVVPIPRIAFAVSLTWVVCLLAGIRPALKAARSNVIEAMAQV